MIKKSLMAFSMVACFGLATMFSVNSSEAQNVPTKKWGSSETIEQTSECVSGKKRKCEGDGSLCTRTIGWDCV